MKRMPTDATIATSQDRRREVRARHHNGLDIVEVHESRRGLALMFLEPAPAQLGPANIRIDAPPAQPAVAVTSVRRVASSDPKLRDHLIVELSGVGGEGVYQVSMVETAPDGRPGTSPLRGLDPRFTSCSVRFDIDEPGPVPTIAKATPAPLPSAAPSYLARDYDALRQLLLDRLTEDVPGWSEQHVPDVIVMLVELLAFLGDDLSYYQDAVASEAYLQTARQRTSIRRHARLVGYPFHEGCNARAWVNVTVSADCDVTLRQVSFLAETPSATMPFAPVRAELPAPYGPGETPAGQHPWAAVVSMRLAHNAIRLWDWGESDTYLPVGATEATLAEPDEKGSGVLQLAPGDLVMFEEMTGADGGPRDETHRHVVRLTRVAHTRDPLLGRGLLEVEWDSLDALPFQLPITIPVADAGETTRCAVAHANLILVDQGSWITDQTHASSDRALDQPNLSWSCPYPDLDRVAVHQAIVLKNLYYSWRRQLTDWQRRAHHGEPLDEHQRSGLARQFGREIVAELDLRAESDVPPKERAVIDAAALWILLARADDLLESRIRRLRVLSRLAAASGPLSGPLLAELRHDWGDETTRGLDPHYPAAWGSAAEATTQDPTKAQPVLKLVDATSTDGQPPTQWEVTTGLVDAEPETPRVIVEMDDDRTARLRFNPAAQPQASVVASYLVGNGSAGNVAAETITSVSGAPAAVVSVRNPLPATGGCDPETLDQARRAIPLCYLNNQPRALTPADYATIAETLPGVRSAAARLTWSGNRLAVRVAVQPAFGEDPPAALLGRVEHALAPARRIDHDLRVTGPDYRPVVIGLTVQLDPNAVGDLVREQIAELLGSGALSDGRPAFFSPVNFSFGDSLFASALVAAVQELDGVASVSLTQLAFLAPGSGGPAAAVSDHLRVSATAIIRCDNNPVAKENGYAQLTMVGGR
jgi:predicted phage baseplate assembly protein